MKKSTRLLGAVLSVLLILSCFAVAAYALGPEVEVPLPEDAVRISADGYVCIKENQNDGYVITKRAYDKKGRMTKEVVTDMDDEGTVTKKETRTLTYDKAGNITKDAFVSRDEDGNFENSTQVFTFDKKGNLLKRYDVSNRDGVVISSQDVYSYDKAGRMTKDVYTATGGMKKVYNYIYKAGRLAQEVSSHKEADGFTYNVTVTYAYDKSGNLIKITDLTRSSDGDTRKEVVTYTYDKAGNVTSRTSTLGRSKESTVYTYNKNKKVTKSVYTYRSPADGISTKEVTTYTYNKSGQMERISVTFRNNNGLNRKETTIYTYDKNGRLVKMAYAYAIAETGLTPSKTVTTYAYDKKGNLIEKRENGFWSAHWTYQHKKIGA